MHIRRTATGGIALNSSTDAAFLTRKWAKELDYRLIKELWAFGGNRIGDRYAYEWHDDSGNWFRSYGNENWEYDAAGLISFLARNPTLQGGEVSESGRWPLLFGI